MLYKPTFETDKQELLLILKSKTKRSLDRLVTIVVKDALTREKNLKKIYEYFSYLYEHFYHENLFGHAKISKPTIKLLEFVSTPIYDQPAPIQKLLLAKIQRKIATIAK